jgi:formylglycine-generating enzyme
MVGFDGWLVQEGLSGASPEELDWLRRIHGLCLAVQGLRQAEEHDLEAGAIEERLQLQAEWLESVRSQAQNASLPFSFHDAASPGAVMLASFWLRSQLSLQAEAADISSRLEELGMPVPRWAIPHVEAELAAAKRRIGEQDRLAAEFSRLQGVAARVADSVPDLAHPFDSRELASLAERLQKREERWEAFESLEYRASLIGWPLRFSSKERDDVSLPVWEARLGEQERLSVRFLSALEAGRRMGWEERLLDFPLEREEVAAFVAAVDFHAMWMEEMPRVHGRMLPWDRPSLPLLEPPFDARELTAFVDSAKPLLRRGRPWYLLMAPARMIRQGWSTPRGRIALCLSAVALAFSLSQIWMSGHVRDLRSQALGMGWENHGPSFPYTGSDVESFRGEIAQALALSTSFMDLSNELRRMGVPEDAEPWRHAGHPYSSTRLQALRASVRVQKRLGLEYEAIREGASLIPMPLQKLERPYSREAVDGLRKELEAQEERVLEVQSLAIKAQLVGLSLGTLPVLPQWEDVSSLRSLVAEVGDWRRMSHLAESKALEVPALPSLLTPDMLAEYRPTMERIGISLQSAERNHGLTDVSSAEQPSEAETENQEKPGPEEQESVEEGTPAEADAAEELAEPAGLTPFSVPIPAGSFKMGREGHSVDTLEHQVTVTRSYRMMSTEVTQGLYLSVGGSNPSKFSSCGPTCPVDSVSWFDAVVFANSLSERDGLKPCYRIAGEDVSWPQGLRCRGWRLPTEAEWEHAARAGGGTRYAGSDSVGDVAWYRGNSGDMPHPAGVRSPNPYGLHDMAGNVWEWCWDGFAPYGGAVADPTGRTDGSTRAMRGGGWLNGAGLELEPSYRSHAYPMASFSHLGFRLVRTE